MTSKKLVTGYDSTAGPSWDFLADNAAPRKTYNFKKDIVRTFKFLESFSLFKISFPWR